MSVITINNKNNPKNMRLRVTYTAGSGQITISKIETCRTDGYDTTSDGVTASIIYTFDKGTSQETSVSQTFRSIFFYKNNNYSTLDISSSTKELQGLHTVSITFSGTANSNINNSRFDFDVDCGYKTPTMLISGATPYLESVKLTCSYTGATPTQIQVKQGDTVVYTGSSLEPTITGLTPDNTYSFSVRGYANGQWGSYSSSLTVTTLSRAYITSAQSLNTSSNQLQFNAINPSGSSTKLKVYVYNETEPLVYILYDDIDIVIPRTETTITLSLTSAMINSICEVAYNTPQAKINFDLTTVGSSTYSVSVWTPFDFVNPYPTLGNITYQDTNSTTTAITGNNQKIISNKSNVRITIPKMGTQYSAQKSYYNIVYNNMTILSFADDGSNTYTKDCGTIDINGTLQVEAVDSRGYSVIKDVNLTMIDYDSPQTNSFVASRQNDVGERTTIRANGTYYRLATTANKNAIQQIKYRYRKINTNGTYGNWSNYQNVTSFTDNLDGTWSITDIAINGDTSAGYDTEYSYQIELYVADKLDFNETYYNLSTSKPTTWYDRQHKRMGIGKKPEKALDVEGDSRITGDYYINNVKLLDIIYPVGSIYISTEPTNPNSLFGGSWTQIKDKFLLTAGDTYTAGNTGGSATHTLTINEMPSHTHDGTRHYQSTSSTTGYSTSWESQKYETIATGSTGGDQPFSIMPPYLVVYAWKRTS